MTERITKPEGSVTLELYDDLAQFVSAFASRHLNLLIVIGRAGIAKSQTVRGAVSDRACWIEGNATAFGMYTRLYKHRDKPVVIDDVDSLYSDRAAVRLLKCICQTDPEKSVAWNSAAVGNSEDDIPSSFRTKSQVCHHRKRLEDA